jgi:glutamate transport system permease protein
MEAITDNLDLFGRGILKTLEICLWSGVLALVIGTIIAMFRVSPLLPLRATGTIWVNAIRNCPLTIVLYFLAFGLPEAGVSGTFVKFGVSGLAIYTSAFVCEAIRSGVNSVAFGQAEAARAIGLGFIQSLRFVVMPQAFRTVLPPLGNVLIAMIKNSAIVGAFGVGGELYSVGQSLTSAQGYAALPVLTGITIGYLILTLPAGALVGYLERRVAIVR